MLSVVDWPPQTDITAAAAAAAVSLLAGERIMVVLVSGRLFVRLFAPQLRRQN